MAIILVSQSAKSFGIVSFPDCSRDEMTRVRYLIRKTADKRFLLNWIRQ